MSANLVANVTFNGTLTVQGPFSNVQYMNAATSNLFTFTTGKTIVPAIAVAGGAEVTVIILANGTVRTIGVNSQGQLGVNDTTSRLTPVQVWGISSSATAVACGRSFTAVLLGDGTVRTFGANSYGELGVNDTATRSTPVPVWGISSSASAIACGWYHTAILLANGTVMMFGRNSSGQLGVNDTTSRLTPVQVLNITSATAVAAGFLHTVVLLADGTVRTFGYNISGQLGVNDSSSRLTPVQVWGISSSAVAVATGFNHTVVLLTDGTVRTFGFGNLGQLGVNDTTNRFTPVQVWGISSSAVAIAGGEHRTAVLLADGTVRTFGQNTQGQLGVNDTTTRLTPVQVLNITSATAVAGGRYHTATILADGTVRTIGGNASGQLGVNDTTSRLTPVQVVSGYSATAQGTVAGGFYSTAILMADGTVRTFGKNNRGQLGLGDTTSRLTPVQISGITSANAVGCGNYFSAILLNNGTVRSFGFNNWGQLGVNDTTQRYTPVQVWGISSSATAIACGGYQVGVLLADKTVRMFGSNSNGQLGVGDTTSRLTPVQVLNITSAAGIASGTFFTLVVLADGTVRSFGANSNGQLGLNDTTSRLTPVQVWGISSSATAVACGGDHAAILLTDGTVRTFGYNGDGRLGLNDTVNRLTPVQVFGISSSAVAVACGYNYTAVLLANGTVRTFGENVYGGLGVGDLATRLTPVQVWGISSSAIAIACGTRHTVVFLSDGTGRTFGSNNSGELGVADAVDRRIPVKVGVSGNKVAGGAYYTAVVSNDGTVRTFGRNNNGQLGLGDTTQRNTPVQVTGLTSATAVACAGETTAVLLNDGTVRTFGRNDSGQLGINVAGGSRLTPVQVSGITTAIAIAGEGFGNLAILLANGTVQTIGDNSWGQLGIDVSGGTRQTPVQVLNITSATAVACGYLHTIVLLADGTVRTFGFSSYGQLGVNDTNSRQTPVQVWGISSSAVGISGARSHTAVLLADGTIRSFGANNNGQLGLNDTTTRLTPVQVLNITSATAVTCGYYNTAVLLADGTVRTFGSNRSGGLGLNDTTNRSTPVQVWGISSSATAITSGYYFTSVLLQDGTVRTFGDNQYGELGVNDTTSRLTPVQVIAAGAVTALGKVADGAYHTAVILTDGTVRTFGFNAQGGLGVNDTISRLTPVQVWGISSSAVTVACGLNHTVVLLGNNTVQVFGRNGYGQLGVNDTTNRFTPVQITAFTSATTIACGNEHTAILLADGTVRTFGFNQYGNLGVNDTTVRSTPVQVWGISSSATAIACGRQHTGIIIADGTVRTFGQNNNGQLGVNDGTQRNTPVQVWGISSSASAIACGRYHTAVLLTNGTVLTFGYNSYGPLGVGDGTNRSTPVQVWGISSSATAIACGYYHTIVLLNDGTVRTFGYNFYGQLGVNDTTNRFTPVQVTGITNATAIASGYYHSSILLANGTVRTFGWNPYGQLGVNDTTQRNTPVQVTGITTAITPVPSTYITNATAIVVPLSSAAPLTAVYLTSAAQSLNSAFVFNGPVFTSNIGLGRVPDINYQLDMSTDGARKTFSSTWTTGSDIRIKSDVVTANLARCAEIVDSLDLKYFKWNFPEGQTPPPDSHSLGWIAQDVQQFFPKSVETSGDFGLGDFHSLNSDQLVKVLWGALKHTLNEHFPNQQ